MITLSKELLNTKLDFIDESNFKDAFKEAIQVKLWLNNKKAYAVASNQLGLKHHFFVVDNYKRWGMPTDVFFNATYEPENVDEQFMSQETCLSYPGQTFIVMRHPKVHMKYYDPRDKQQKECFLSGVGAVIAQHEIDHINGITDLDSMKMLSDKVEEFRKKEEEEKPPEEKVEKPNVEQPVT